MKLYGAASATFSPSLPFPTAQLLLPSYKKGGTLRGGREKRRETEAKKRKGKSENPTFSSGFSSFSFLSP